VGDSNQHAGRAREVGGSLWIARSSRGPRPSLSTPLEVDVAIIGGGIVGTSAAMLLAAEDVDVALVEARQVGFGNTGLSTAKASIEHGLWFAKLIDDVGEEDAREILASERAALDVMRKWADELEIPECAESVTHWLYTNDDKGLKRLRREADAASTLGIGMRWANEGEVPFGAHALGITEQLNIEPVLLCEAFVDRAERHGAKVFEGSRVVDISLGDTCSLVLDSGGTIRAKHVICATQAPIIDRSMVFAASEYFKSHVVALEHPGPNAVVRGMYTGIGKGLLSVRPAVDVDGTPLFVVAGESHELDTDEDGTHIATLEQHARELTGGGKLRRAWLAHDLAPGDGRPLIGPIHGHDNVHIATGFNAWGLASGVAASLAITGLIVRGHARWIEPLSARRLGPYVKPTALKTQIAALKGLVVDRFTTDDAEDVAGLEPGTGLVATIERRPIAIARDLDGELRAVSATCTHLGCVIAHDAERGCWQCPCHGSRFDLDGTVLQGPAMKALEVVDVSQLELPDRATTAADASGAD
jgi:glycine/D-amino acid oxidase-like deaminating enzyme/nitrite reductase/ring-hydroxylating ferredoxin subunit